MKALQDALRLLVLYAEKQIALRSNKSDYCPKEDTAAIEATTTVKVCVSASVCVYLCLPVSVCVFAAVDTKQKRVFNT